MSSPTSASVPGVDYSWQESAYDGTDDSANGAGGGAPRPPSLGGAQQQQQQGTVQNQQLLQHQHHHQQQHASAAAAAGGSAMRPARSFVKSSRFRGVMAGDNARTCWRARVRHGRFIVDLGRCAGAARG